MGLIAMKDSKGHGSNPRGAHASGVEGVGKPVPVSPRAIRIITKQAGTGFSVSPSGAVPETGYQVALHGHTDAEPLDLDNIAAHVRAHVEANRGVYASPNTYIGGWNSPYTGKVHLEPSRNIPYPSIAKDLGKARNQHSIWNNGKGEEIRTGGSGR
jgi:hypothetical protein